MKEFLYRLRESFRKGMAGRLGQDELNRDLVLMYFAVFVLQILFRGVIKKLLVSLNWVIFLFYLYRFFSKNISTRNIENRKYLDFRKKLFERLKVSEFMDKGHRYFDCPNCKSRLRIPKGVGNVTVTCPKCGHEFKKEVK